MLKRYASIIILAVIAVACSKDKLETKPSIEIKSINGTEFTPQMPINIVLTFRDKEGDLGGGLIKYYRNRLNVVYPVTNPMEDSVTLTIPDFPRTSTGEINLNIPPGRLDQNPDFNDTVIWKIIVVDVAGNVSDTVSTPTLIDINE